MFHPISLTIGVYIVGSSKLMAVICIHVCSYETEESKVQETTYSYLHTHLHNDFLDKELQKLEVEKLNIHTTVDEDLLVAEADVFRDYTSKSSKPGIGSLRPPKAPTAETDVFRNSDVKSSRMGLAIRLPTSPTPNSLKPSLKLGKNTSRSFCLFGGQYFRVLPGEVERLSSCEQDVRMSTTSTLPPQVSQKEFAYAEALSTSSNDLRQEKNVSKFSKAPLFPSGLLKQRKIASEQISNEKNVGVVSVGKRAFGAIVPKLILPQSQETESTSSALRHFSDGETTSYLTEELFLASLENEAATTRLIQEVTSRFDGCKLIPLDHRNILSMPASNNESGYRPPAQTIKVTTNISAHNENVVREDRKEMAERLSKQSHNNSQKPVNNEEVKVEHHICSNRRQASPQSNNMMESCATIDSCPEETRSPVTQKNNVAFKVEGHLQIMRKHDGELTSEGNVQPESMKRYLEPINVIHDVGNDRIGYEHCQRTNDEKCSTVQLSAVGGIRDEEISSISRARSIDNRNRRSPAHVLSPLYTESEHEIEHRMNNIKSIARPPMSLSYVNSDISLVTNRVEAAVTSGASTTRVVDCQCPSNNPGVLSQSSKLSSRKLDVPCNMQSVYERCNLDSVRLPGYTALCTVNYGDEAKQHEGHGQVRPPSAKLASILSHSEDVPTRSPESTFREEINMYHDISGNKENLGKENCYADMCTPGSEEEMNILASLERLDWKLAAITGRAMNGGRNSLNSQGHCSAKSAQSAPAVLAHEKPSSTTLGQVGLVCGKPKNCTFMNASRPSVRCVSLSSLQQDSCMSEILYKTTFCSSESTGNFGSKYVYVVKSEVCMLLVEAIVLDSAICGEFHVPH